MNRYFPAYVTGNPKGEPIVLLAGFPDDTTSSFSSLIADLQKEYRLICLCIPGMENSQARRRWGYDFEELIEMLNDTIEHYAPNGKVNMIIHDWGSFLGMMYQNKYSEKVSKMVILDVGITKMPKITELFYIVLYQWTFAISYFVSQAISVNLGNFMFWSFLTFLYFFPMLSVCPYDKEIPRDKKELHVEMCFLYYHFWKRYFTGRKVFPRFPTCPFTFMYGSKKNAMFHSDHFLARIKTTKGCKYRQFESGHWLHLHESQEVLREIRELFGSK